MNKKQEKRKQFSVTIGEGLKDALNAQKEKITELTYGKCYTSDYEAGEILAKKLFENGLI